MFYDITTHRISHIAFTLITLFLSAMSFQRTDVYKNNFSLWMDVVKKSPLKARTLISLGLAYEANNMREDAMNNYLLAARLEPGYAPAHSNLAYIYYEKDMIDDAEKELKLAMQFHKRPFEDLHRRLGFVYMKKGLIDDAIKEFEKAKALISNHPDARYKAAGIYTEEGFSYTDTGDFTRALILHKIAFSIDPDYPNSHYGLAQAYEAFGQKAEAIKHWQEYMRLAPPDEPFRNNAMKHLERLR